MYYTNFRTILLRVLGKFFFFLDPKRTGKIQIKDMLTSPILAELYDLRQQDMSIEDSMNNWIQVHSGDVRKLNLHGKVEQEA